MTLINIQYIFVTVFSVFAAGFRTASLAFQASPVNESIWKELLNYSPVVFLLAVAVYFLYKQSQERQKKINELHEKMLKNQEDETQYWKNIATNRNFPPPPPKH